MAKNKKNKENQNTNQTVLLLLGGVVGGVAGFFGGTYLGTLGITGNDWLYIYIGVLLVIYLQIILHEMGHLLFGVFSGYHFVSFRVGKLILYKKQGKLHLGRYFISGTGGQCLMAPPDLVEGKIPYRLYNLGGSLMNLFVAGIAIVLELLTNPSVFLSAVYLSLIVVGVLFALTNGIPMRLGGIDNDGYNALSLGKNPKALRAFWLQLKVNELLTEGTRLKDMPDEWFEKPSEDDMKNNMIAAIEAMRCNRLLDMMAFDEMSQAISNVLHSENEMVGIQKLLLKADMVFCEILGERREEILAQIKEKDLVTLSKSMKTFLSVTRTQYAYALLVEQDKKKAAKWKKRFEKSIKRHPYQGEVESERELVTRCEALVAN